jgi:hypothetical protein
VSEGENGRWAGRAKISARHGRAIHMWPIRAGFEPRRECGLAPDRVSPYPLVPSGNAFKATNDNAETPLPGKANPQFVLLALL